MYKYLLFVSVFLILSCTDKGDPIMYSIKNSTNYNFKFIIFERSGIIDTFPINISESKILSQDKPPYDGGPFGGFDSLKVAFEDLKILTYIPLRSNADCTDSIKNPFCPYSNYSCIDNTCTFVIDNTEYLKAR